MTTPRCGLLFHTSHLDNVPSVLAAGALLSDTAVTERHLLVTEAADPEIKERRRGLSVTCSPGGVVADYVPFYFAARSPMMYKLFAGGVSSFARDHRDLVYFVTDVGRVVAAQRAFVISDRNAAKVLADFTNDVSALGDLTVDAPKSTFIDWPLMKAKMWKNTLDDGERMERRMAEFLVHEEVPLDLITHVGVRDAARKATVERMFATVGRTVNAVVRHDWYYS
jgi:hypothetical protein